jgi:hypothetical protein
MAKNALYLRNPDVVLVGAGASSIVVGPRGTIALDGIAGELLSTIVRAALAPVTAKQLGANGETIARLVEHGVLLAGASADSLLKARGLAPADAVGRKPAAHVVLGVTGAINAIHSHAIARHLAHYVCDRLDVVLTRSARRIVRADAFRYLGLDTWTDAFAPRGADNVPHIRLAKADLIAIIPATARTLDKLVRGACSDLLSLVCTATRAPIVVAPSMNVAMWDHPGVAANLRTLRERGVYVIEPEVGTEVSDRDRARWELGPSPIDPDAIARALTAVLAASRARRSTPAPRARR